MAYRLDSGRQYAWAISIAQRMCRSERQLDSWRHRSLFAGAGYQGVRTVWPLHRRKRDLPELQVGSPATGPEVPVRGSTDARLSFS